MTVPRSSLDQKRSSGIEVGRSFFVGRSLRHFLSGTNKNAGCCAPFLQSVRAQAELFSEAPQVIRNCLWLKALELRDDVRGDRVDSPGCRIAVCGNELAD